VSDLSRRDLLKLLAAAPLPLLVPPAALAGARRAAREAVAAPGQHVLRFLTEHEFRTVRLLADLLLPRDERSGSASDAGVPEFIDTILHLYPADQDRARGGLAWLDAHCRRRFGKPFAEGSGFEQTGVLDEIAWPARARPEVSHGVAFFNAFRDLVATGFWSSKMGVDDLGYVGNTFVTEWTGCPPEVLERLRVR
jgi:gluconate 2-dehydrogenase gamma chain